MNSMNDQNSNAGMPEAPQQPAYTPDAAQQPTYTPEAAPAATKTSILKKKWFLPVIIGAVVVLAVVLWLLIAKPFHECTGTWYTETAPTVTKTGTEYRVCTICGESVTREIPAIGVEKVHSLLKGTWVSEDDKFDTIYLYDKFDNGKFHSAIKLTDGSDILPTDGTYTITDTRITLIENDGDTYSYYTFVIKENSIELTSYDGTKWVKKK